MSQDGIIVMTGKILFRLFTGLLLGSMLLMPARAAEVQILRDRQGVPHVYGENDFEVFFGFGYVMATDRLFQMEMRKRQALGTTAEILGKGDKRWPDKYLSKDRDARIMHDRAALKVEYDNLSMEDKFLIDGFTAGVNKAIGEALSDPTNKLPKPFVEYGFLPHPWTTMDTVIYAVDVLGAYSSFTTQLVNLELYQFLRQKYPHHCDDIFNQLLWKTDVNAPTTARDQQNGGADPADTGPKGCADVAPNGLQIAPKPERLGGIDHLIARETAPKRASMSWAVGRDKAQGFRSIFVNGPQPGWHIPSYYYPVGLHGGQFDLVGFSAEGSFVLEAGVNNQISWGLTAGLGNHVDLYQEVLEAPGSTRYRFKDGWRDMTSRTEVIKVKGEAPDNFVIRSTVHGPVIAGSDSDKTAISQAISWQGAGLSSAMAWVHAGHAANYEQWLGRARSFAFGYNWFYADNLGQVGAAYTGRFATRRPDQDIRLPASGSGDFDWTGFLAPDANPAKLTTGFIVNFNNKPAKNWPNSGLYWEQWAEANQVDILLAEVQKKDKLSWNDMWAINRVVSYKDVSASYFIPFILKALNGAPKDSDLDVAAQLLAGWNQMRTDDDHDGRFDHPGQTLFDAWLPLMVRNTLAPTLEGFSEAGIWLAAGYQTKAPRLEEHPTAGTLVTYHALLSSEGRSGVRHYYDFFQGNNPEDVIRTSLLQAIEKLKKTYKGPMTAWLSPAVEQVFFDSNTNRIPTTSPGLQLTLPLYANRGALNLQSGYSLDGTRVVAGFVNPPGQSGFIPPNGQATDNPLFGNHLRSYRDQGLNSLHLRRDVIINNLGAEPIVVKVDDPFKPKL